MGLWTIQLTFNVGEIVINKFSVLMDKVALTCAIEFKKIKKNHGAKNRFFLTFLNNCGNLYRSVYASSSAG